MLEPTIWTNFYGIVNICGRPEITSLTLDSLKQSFPGEIEFLFTPKEDFTLDSFGSMIKQKQFDMNRGMRDSETGDAYEYDEGGAIIKTQETKSKRNPAYHTAFSRMLWKACNTQITWFCFFENDIILNSDFIKHCLDAHKRATADGFNVGLVSPLDWGFEWYNKGIEGYGYVVKEWMTSHCLIMHRDTLIRGIDLTKSYWHEYNYELDKFIGKDLTERKYTNICATPSRAYSMDGGIYAETSRAIDDKTERLVNEFAEIELRKQKEKSGEQEKK